MSSRHADGFRCVPYRVISLDLEILEFGMGSLHNVGLCLHELLEMNTANVA